MARLDPTGMIHPACQPNRKSLNYDVITVFLVTYCVVCILMTSFIAGSEAVDLSQVDGKVNDIFITPKTNS